MHKCKCRSLFRTQVHGELGKYERCQFCGKTYNHIPWEEGKVLSITKDLSGNELYRKVVRNSQVVCE